MESLNKQKENPSQTHSQSESKEGITPFKIDAPTLDELQAELIANCKEVISDVLLLECLIQLSKEETITSNIYTASDYDLALHRVVNYIEQHSNDICTLSNGILKRLTNRNIHDVSVDSISGSEV